MISSENGWRGSDRRSQALPIRLVREALAELPRRLGQLFRVNREPRPKRDRQALARGGRGDRVAESRGHRLQAVEHVVRVNSDRLMRHLGRDVGVAVAVATDP